ncbi:MAG: globin [Candidatus Marinarcus sp.]|uniref:globin domain-containing protein n=1 Tax=Candidatus Marinarcus sp. TaxID=3100987 RepID=UPI003AFF9303
MQFTISYGTIGARPCVKMPDPAFLEYVGEEGIRKLVNDHYELLKESKIKDIFPQDEKGLAKAKKHAADFLIQICGGHPHFNENRGAPRMIERHAPFKITQEGRRVWLEAFAVLLSKLDIPPHLIKSFWDYLDIFSIWMVNAQPEKV